MNINVPHWCRCRCGETEFPVTGNPLFRVICHCLICQRFNDAQCADVTVYRAADVERPKPGVVCFATYRAPPNVQRGKCAKCSQAAIEVFDSPIFPNLIMIPHGMFENDVAIPEPVAHIFYQSRVSEANDELPKHNGYLWSQLAFAKYLLNSQFRK